MAVGVALGEPACCGLQLEVRKDSYRLCSVRSPEWIIIELQID